MPHISGLMMHQGQVLLTVMMIGLPYPQSPSHDYLVQQEW